MQIQAKLDAVKAEHERAGRGAQVSLLHALAAAVATEERSRPLKAGDVAPRFRLPDLRGTAVSSDALLEDGPLVVTFYRGLWCPHCQRDLRDLHETMPRIRSAGSSAVAITRSQLPGHGLQAAADHPDSFPTLEDGTGEVAVGFGIRWSMEDSELIDRYLGADIVTLRSTQPWICPMQARFLVGRDGRIAFAESAFGYEGRTEPSELIPLLTRVSGQGG
ncbi:MAG: AhpC/TSA family protein [Parafilimonas terrae]|nr:AhpC/TSA family protein [Parafilimonas terrae]